MITEQPCCWKVTEHSTHWSAGHQGQSRPETVLGVGVGAEARPAPDHTLTEEEHPLDALQVPEWCWADGATPLAHTVPDFSALASEGLCFAPRVEPA